MHGLPDHADVLLEIPVCDPVAHAFHAGPRHRGVSRNKVAVVLQELCGELTDHEEVKCTTACWVRRSALKPSRWFST